MIRRLFVLCCLAAACGTPPEFLPPPFGPGSPTNTRLFFPTGLAPTPSGGLLVVNGNFNHAYDGGTLVSLRKAYLDAFFAQKLSCDTPTPAPACDDDVRNHPGDVFGGAVMIGNYAGPLALNDAGTVAYTGSRDSSTLNAVSILPDESLQCAPGAGTTPDCRKGLLDLSASRVIGPYSIVPGDVQLPGEASRRVLFVSSMIPFIDQNDATGLFTSAHVAALDMNDPSQVLFTMTSASRLFATQAGTGPMVFDAARHQLVLGGCFERFAGTGAGEPGTGLCTGISNNFLRFLDVDAGGASIVQLYDIYGDVLSTNTVGLLLGDPDPVTQEPMSVWATLRTPDVLVQVQLPSQPSVAPRVRRIVPLPVSPSELVRIPRPGRPDLLAIVAEKTGAVVFYDTGSDELVAQVEHLGDSPFSLVLLSQDASSARLATTVFNSCSVALIEVPLDAPWDAALRGRVGRCP